MTSQWTRDHVAKIDQRRLPATPVIVRADIIATIPGIDLWDMWPVQELDGAIACIADGSLWFSLSAPVTADPIERHALARLRLLHKTPDGWRDLGDALPDGFSPGSREWSGSAIVDLDHRELTLFFTVAGRRGEAAPTFEQRLFQSSATLSQAGGTPMLRDWTEPVESVRSDGLIYHPADQREGAVGTIKAFRDPGFFRDPADGQNWLLFAGSDGRSNSAFNGVVGAAAATDHTLQHWRLEQPLIAANALNNELERPHAVYHGNRYYLFWSTQRSVFDPSGPTGPSGLYGMVGDRLLGPYEPLNGTGLVLCNPPEEPHQAYSWLVLDDLSVVSFVDLWGLAGKPASDGVRARCHFGGVPAPVRHLRLSGTRAW